MKSASICYIDHETGESDHMNAHIQTERCMTPTPPVPEIAALIPEEARWVVDWANHCQESSIVSGVKALVGALVAFQERLDNAAKNYAAALAAETQAHHEERQTARHLDEENRRLREELTAETQAKAQANNPSGKELGVNLKDGPPTARQVLVEQAATWMGWMFDMQVAGNPVTPAEAEAITIIQGLLILVEPEVPPSPSGPSAEQENGK